MGAPDKNVKEMLHAFALVEKKGGAAEKESIAVPPIQSAKDYVNSHPEATHMWFLASDLTVRSEYKDFESGWEMRTGTLQYSLAHPFSMGIVFRNQQGRLETARVQKEEPDKYYVHWQDPYSIVGPFESLDKVKYILLNGVFDDGCVELYQKQIKDFGITFQKDPVAPEHNCNKSTCLKLI